MKFSAFKRLLLLALVVFAVGCESCQEEKPVEPPPKPPEPDLAVKEEPVDPLKEAKEDAEPKAEELAVLTGDTARAAAAEIEAAANKPPKRNIVKKVEKPTGQIDPKDLKKVFNRHLGAMKKCYERELKKNPGLEGKVVLTVVIKSDGKVGRANAKGKSLRNARVNDCIEREARGMKFPKPKGGSVIVNNPYTFTPDI